MKKIFPPILITTIATLTLVGPLGAGVAHAGWLNYALEEVLAGVGNALLGVCSWFLFIAAKIFDYAIALSINNAALSAEVGSETGLVKVGWRIARDVANLFFIFVIIFIGIATILQIERFGFKRLLLNVIIIALLVNFSLFVAQTVISASNVLAMEFYDKITPPKGETTMIAGFKVKGLAAIFAAGLRAETIYDVSGTDFAQVGDRQATASQIIIISVFGSALTLVAAFVLAAGGMLFVVRYVSLQLIMVVGPLAFLALALPQTKRYGMQWWEKLFKQSFFAPAFLFLFYLVAKIINEQSFVDLLGAQQTGYAAIFFNKDASPNVALIIQFIILIMLMLGTLVVANMMGARGADAAIKWGQRGAKAAQGYAGKLGGRIPRRLAGPAAEAFAKGEGEGRITGAIGRFGAKMREVPIAGRLATRKAAEIARANRTRLEQLKKQYSGYTVRELKNMLPGKPRGFERTALLQLLAEKGDLNQVPNDQIKAGIQVMKRYGISTDAVDALKWQWAETPEEKKQALSLASGETIEKIAQGYNRTPEKGKPRAFKDYFEKEEILEELVKSISPSKVKKLYDVGGPAADAFFQQLVKLGKTEKTLEAVSNNLLAIGNRSLASWVNSGPAAKSILEAYGLREKAEVKSPLITANLEQEFRKRGQK
jgi:hypothetical protein